MIKIMHDLIKRERQRPGMYARPSCWEMAKYESYFQTHMEHKYTGEKRIILGLSQRNYVERVLFNHSVVF